MIRQTVLAGIVYFSGLLAPQAALADAAGEALVSDIINAMSSAPNWTATSNVIRSDGDRVIVEGLSVVNSSSSLKVSVEAIEFKALSERGGGYAASAVSVNGMTVDYDLISMFSVAGASNADVSMVNKVSVETIDIEDLYLPKRTPSGTGGSAEGFLAPLIAVYSYFAEVEMSSAVVPIVVTDQTVSGPDTGGDQTSRITYRDSRISNWRDGLMERMEIGRIDMTMSGGPSGEMVISADGAFAEHFDLAHYNHVLDPAKYQGGRGDGVWKTALKRIEYFGIRMNVDQVELQIAKVVAADFDMRQSEEPFLNGFDKLLAIAASGREPDEAEALALVGDLFGNMLGAVRMGLMRIEGATGRPIVSSDPGSFAMNELTVAGISAEGVDRFSIDGVAVTGPDNFAIKLDTVGFSGLTMPAWDLVEDFIKAAASGEDVEKDPELMARIVDLYPSIDTFSMRGLSGNAPGKETMKVDEIVLEVTQRVAGFMVGGSGAVRGVTFPASYLDDTGDPNPLRLLGYDRILMDYVFQTAWDEATTILEADAVLSIEDLGELKLGYGLSGITDAEVRRMIKKMVELEASGQSEDPAQIMELLQNLGTTGVSLSFADRSIVQRALRVAAEQQNADAATYGQQLKAAIPFFLSAIPASEFREQAINAAQAALDGGQKTTFSLSPGRAITVPEIMMAAMQDPLSLIDLLGAGAATEPVK